MKIARRIVRFAAGIALGLACVATIGFLVAAQEGFAQPTAGPQDAIAQPAFEVASVKPLPDYSDPLFRVDHGNLTSRMGVTYLIAWAYGVPFQQVVAPEWGRFASMDIVAKAAGPVGEDQVRLMLRTLLADRFKLTVHRESREKRVLALMVEKGAPRLKVSKIEGPWKRRFDNVGLREIYTGITMSEFTTFLAQYFNGCLDRTGLTGRYDFVLEYQPLVDPEKSAVLEVIRTRPEALNQIGLKLQVVTAPLEFIVVDHVERIPTEN